MGRRVTLLFVFFSAFTFSSFFTGCPNSDSSLSEISDSLSGKSETYSFEINNGKTTNSLSVMLYSRIKSKDHISMRFRNEYEGWQDWIDYTENGVPWELSIADGKKTVYAEYHKNGQPFLTMQNSINLDTGAPPGEFYIWGSAVSGNRHLYVNTENVTLCTRLEDGNVMNFSNDGGSTWGGFMPFSRIADWTLSAGDGLKVVDAEFQTYSGSIFADCQITLDTTPPLVAAFSINSGDPVTNSTDVVLETGYMDANDVWARYRNDGGQWSQKEKLSGSPSYRSWKLRNAAGERTVYIELSDIAGNVSVEYSDTIIYSTGAAGAPVVSIDSISYAFRPQWNWTTGGGGSGLYRYKLDDSDLSIGATETNNTFFVPGFDLSDGPHTLYVQEQDLFGTWSPSGSATTQVSTTFTISTEIVPGGSGTVMTGSTAILGIPESIEVLPDPAYNFVTWEVASGTGVTIENQYAPSTTVTLTQGDATIRAFMELKTYTLWVIPGPNGSVSAGGTVQHGIPFPVTATPDFAYIFAGWSVTGGTGVTIDDPMSATTTVTLTDGNAEVTANFVPDPLYDGLQVYYTFTGNALDSSGNGLDAVVYGGSALTADRFSNPDSAYYFDGIDSYIEQVTQDYTTTSNVSVSFWIRSDAPPGGTVNFIGCNDFLVSQNNLQINFLINIPMSISATATMSSYGQWYHFVGTYDGSVVRTYLNGVPAGTNTMAGTISDLNEPLTIGKRAGAYPFWEGYIDSFRIYNRTLTPGEVTQLYNYDD